MICNHDRSALVALHFGAIEPDERAEVEARLIACPPCLHEYLAVKRAIEAGEDSPRPPDAVRRRVRGAVARLLVAPPVARRPWWHRPAAAAFALAMLLASIAVMNKVTARGAPPYATRVGGP